ncbi:hypothetical protein P4048_00035 [Pseudomonas aeruginosa]|nr:hypothetical protein [Pseudomonas aeruginosa]
MTLDVAEQRDNRGGKAIVAIADFASPRHGYSTRTAGYFASRDGLRLNGAELFTGNGGLLSSQQSIDVILDGVLCNQAGSLCSQGRPER